MNIEQYRAMKAMENNPPVVEEVKEEVVDVKVDEPVVEKNYIEINGEEIKIDELKNGYLRQGDYTKKTQQLASDKKDAEEAIAFYNQLKQSPETINVIKNNMDIPENLDPTQSKIKDLEDKLYDMIIEKEVSDLQAKYEDFEVMEVMKVAGEKGIANLEDAYFISKAQSSKANSVSDKVDITSIKEQLMKEIKEEFAGGNTDSIISTKQSGTIEKKELTITPSEMKVAKGMGFSNDEYVKWRDANKK